MGRKDGKRKAPDYFSYHRSLGDELEAIKDRIRDLVCHDLTDGTFKEAALRSVLRRHLPETLLIAKGFVVTEDASSTECDILIVDRGKPTLFKDGDLVIVTPDTVKAIIEVKTELRGKAKITDALKAIVEKKRLCCAGNKNEGVVWAGLFMYSADDKQDRNLLESVGSVCQEKQSAIDCVCLGPNLLARFHAKGLPKAIRAMKSRGDETCDSAWALWSVPGLSAAYFLGDMLVNAANVGRKSGRSIWSPRFRRNNKLRLYLPFGTAAAKEIT